MPNETYVKAQYFRQFQATSLKQLKKHQSEQGSIFVWMFTEELWKIVGYKNKLVMLYSSSLVKRDTFIQTQLYSSLMLIFYDRIPSVLSGQVFNKRA